MPPHRSPAHSRRAFLLASAGVAVTAAGCGGSSSKLPPTSSADVAPAPEPTTSAASQATTAPVEGTTTTESEAATSAGTSTAEASPLAAVPGPPATGGTPGGKIVVGYLNAGNSWDPAIGYSETGWDSICNMSFAPLYSYGEGDAPQPNAAAALPEVSPDGLVYTIPLRPGVQFHNGRAVTAADYQYAFDRTLDPKNESWAASYLYSIDGAQARYEGKASDVKGVRVVDDMTLEVTLTQPDVTFLYALTQPYTAPVPKEEVERLGDKWGTSMVVGNGPFRMVDFDSTAQRAHFQRFDGYFWPGLPYLDEIEMQWGLDASVQLLKLQRGEVDTVYSGFTPAQVQRVNASDKLKPLLFSAPLFSNRWVNLHPGRVAAFKDPRVRQALNLATDRDQLARISGQESDPWGAPFPKGFVTQQRTFQPFGHDPERAKSLLAEAGGPVQFTFYVSDSPEPELGQILQQQWKAVGIDAKLKHIGIDASYELSAKGQLDAWFSTYYAVYPTAIDLISQYYETGGSANYTKYTNADVDRLTAQARQTVDGNARDTLLAQVEQAIGDDAVHVYLQNVNWLMGVNQERLQNFHYSGVYGAYYDRLWVSA